MARDRSLVLVAGSGRSGTSLCAGLLQRLGFHVPRPEVPADDADPRGFAESQWVVDFHTGLLKRAKVGVADARPAAWAHTAEVGFDADVQRTLRAWLSAQFRDADHVVIKDPRLSWFLPLWRRCADEVGVPLGLATVLRHPAAVVHSKQRWSGGRQRDVGHTAGWVNQTLFSERATRDATRVFVRYEDLLDDWTQAIARVGERLDLAVVRDARTAPMRNAHELVDRSPSPSNAGWEGLEIPEPLRAQADEVWELMSLLATDSLNSSAPVDDRLDATRSAYVALYADAEAIARSSIEASRRAGSPSRGPAPAARLIRVVPQRYRRKVPHRLRARLLRLLSR